LFQLPGTGKCEYLESKDKFVGVWSAGARVHGLVFFADGTVERVGYLNNRLVRRELIDPDEQARLKREEKASECEVTAAADGTASLARGSQVESRMGSGPPEAVTVSLVR